MAARIPAWKRLGLKLKYAKEDPDPAELSRFQHSKQSQQVVESHKSNDLDVNSRSTKRRRLNGRGSSPTQDLPSYINGHSQHEQSHHTDHDTRPSDVVATGSRANGQANRESASKKRKNVSFAQDANLGESDLRSNETSVLDTSGSTVAKAHGDQPGATTKTASALSKNTSRLGKTNEPTQQSKTKSKDNKKRKSQPAASGTKPTAALDYLSQHHEHREQWKFNKNRDVWILSHAQDVDSIPRSHDLALAGYVHGLPEQTASRNRLLSECRTNLESTTTSLSDAERTEAKKALLSVLENAKSATTNGSVLERVQKLPRSLLLLWALGASETLTNSKPRSSKKSRTSVLIEVSTSEEEDSSDSSSSSESSDESDAEKIRNSKDSKAGRGRDAGGSNSGSSDDDTSSSGSDEDTSSDGD